MVSFVLWEHEAQVRFLHPRPVCPGDGTGIRVGLRSQILGVRVSSGAPCGRNSVGRMFACQAKCVGSNPIVRSI